MAATFAHLGYPGYEVVRSLYDLRIDRLLNEHRRKYNYIPLTRGGGELIKEIIEIFSRNEFLGLLVDQDTKVRGVFADWFGHPAWTPSGPAYLCYQAGIDAMLLLSHREVDGTRTQWRSRRRCRGRKPATEKRTSKPTPRYSTTACATISAGIRSNGCGCTDAGRPARRVKRRRSALRRSRKSPTMRSDSSTDG